MNWNFLMSKKRGTKGNNGQRKRIYICEIRNGYFHCCEYCIINYKTCMFTSNPTPIKAYVMITEWLMARRKYSPSCL